MPSPTEYVRSRFFAQFYMPFERKLIMYVSYFYSLLFSLIFRSLKCSVQKTYTIFTNRFYCLINFLTSTWWSKNKQNAEWRKNATCSDRTKHSLSDYVQHCAKKIGIDQFSLFLTIRQNWRKQHSNINIKHSPKNLTKKLLVKNCVFGHSNSVHWKLRKSI